MNSSLVQVLFMFVFLHISQNVDGLCPPNSQFDSTEEKCVCKEGYSWVEVTETCDQMKGVTVYGNPGSPGDGRK
ncbi:Hypothetical predicted protein [Mytilus galloprovincialis]|uniref:Uncharacterized protein n=1 Tax=Mytilus galloprovincialis TaxID=29158 RepID=A0A8B6F2B1_MYTGA|nr:Hypothetical predicted protein [Mytilus galloprovincialis]